MPPKQTPDHDPSYKRFFSHPEMVKDLLEGFVHEDWVKELDFTTLEKVSGQFTSDDLRSRDNDVIWRIRWQGKWLYVYILLEFQSRIDIYMAVRFMVYVGLLYQDLLNAKLINGKLPPVLPIVLYNGQPRWKAPLNVADLIEPSPLQKYQPQLHYLLIDEGVYNPKELSSLHNLVAALFRLEKAQNELEVSQVISLLISWLKEPEQQEIRKAFATWLNRVYLPYHLPEVKIPELIDLQEINVMLAERVANWYESGIQKGVQQGKLEGKAEGKLEGIVEGIVRGRTEGIKTALLAILTMRFGEVPPTAQQAIDAIHDTERLEQLMREAIVVDSLATFLQQRIND
ncbi:Rpn family recombination-promoting nuclease/putative transposase [Beggiatoa leptomitoformis]|uniref:Transposase (putative) YhgA-like domain-containing protein n=1 Tax=Beggiatoa leptomitoformis TaxID=288004 RepID=A0A2N9YET0_9GAMM|nr:Rpn family recombination-promoting nuclease/putative transposase [Beggiatoa leptomitoformis]ALG68673.1 hypothetical protein AL038_14380 [Beggiatoa leptomitoformis]AUI68974.1 hypothetical protein BLE401_09880 [Beggiatoa leptomitoformis]